jgi:hypothetical protein
MPTETSTHIINGQTIEIEQTDCTNCGERIARGSARGTRAWRHMLTLSGLCAGGESCAEPGE